MPRQSPRYRRHTFFALFAIAICSSPLRADAGSGAEPGAASLTADARVHTAPVFHEAEGFAEKDVKAIYYDGLPFHDKPTRVFAWYAVPATPAGTKVPGIVLVHGGGGTAFASWVQLWNARGYAAIAMDTCGQVPIGSNAHWRRDEQGGPPGWDATFGQIDDKIPDQWPYHAVADVMLANSLLRSLPGVDPDRIGLTGISWGGYLTCIVAGVDERFRFAVPVYGCGFLNENSTWLPKLAKMGDEKSARWARLWDPSVYLGAARMPMLWIDGTNDFAYPLDSLQKSYRLPASPRTLCTRVRMPHGHPPGQVPPEILAFANSIVSGGPALAKITDQGRQGTSAWVKFESAAPLARAELNYTRDGGNWTERKWETIPATIDVATSRVTATLPDGTSVYYFNLIDGQNLIVSSEHQEIH